MPRPPRPPVLLQQLALLAGVVVLAAVVPVLRTPLLLVTAWGSAVGVLAVLVRRRPSGAGPWYAVSGLLALVAAHMTSDVVVGVETALSGGAVLVGQLLGVVVAVPVVASAARGARGPGAPTHQWADAVLVLAGSGLLAVMAVAVTSSAGGAGGDPLRMARVGLDVVLLGLLLWVALSHAPIPASVALVLAAGSGALLHDLLLAASAPEAVGARGPQLLGIAWTGLFVLAALHPSMTQLVQVRAGGNHRQGSARVLAVLPFAAAPAVVSLAGALPGAPQLPAGVVLGTAVLISALALLRTLSLLRASERQVERDALTGQMNRLGLGRRLEAAHASPEATWAALVDVDGFKEVNDRYGHDAGDVVLQVVAARLAAAVGRDGVVARPGGDEFVVLTSRDDPDRLAARLAACSVDPVTVPGFSRPVPLSIGVARVRNTGPSDGVLADADVAMYAAKQRGGGRVVQYGPELREEVLGRAALLQDVRALLGPDPAVRVGELLVHHQPVVQLSTGVPLGVEALARWSHPQRGMVPPDVFVPLAEELGLGAELDRRVIATALAALRGWDELGLQVHRIGVNLGRGSMASPLLVEDVLAACLRAEVGPDRLMLEITEHDPAPTDPDCAAGLQVLADAGATIALDDFGTGYAGIGYLLRFPVQLLKLDRSLLPVLGASSVPGAVAAPDLLTGVAAMAARMGLEVTAEGLETPEHCDLVRSIGVQHGQGWLFARALPADEVPAFWRSSPSEDRPAAQDAGAASRGAGSSLS